MEILLVRVPPEALRSVLVYDIDVTPLRRLRTCVIKIVTSKGGDKSEFLYYKELLIKEEMRTLWEQILSFNRSSNFKRDAMEVNHYLAQ